MSGLFNDDTLSLYLKLKEAMKQYVRDAMPGGALSPEYGKPSSVMENYRHPMGGGKYINTEEPLGPPTVGPLSLDPTDYIGPKTLANIGLMAKAAIGPAMLGGLLATSKNSVPSMMRQSGQIAWHGSPHKFPPVRELLMPDGTKLIQDLTQSTHLPEGAKVIAEHPFGKFDLSKIGSGEGAQAYGHGLYLAESPEVAQTYQQFGSWQHRANGQAQPVMFKDAPVQFDKMGNVVGDHPKGLKMFLSRVASKGDYDAALNEVKQTLADMKASGSFPSIQDDLAEEIAQATANKARIKASGAQGNLYKTDIPDEAVARFLDWDKPLSQQAKEVQAALGKYVDTDKVKILDLIRKGEQPDGFGVVKSGNGYAPIIGGEVVGNGAKDLVFRSQDEAISYIANRIPATDPTAASIYRRMVGDHGGSDGISQAQVSGLLRQQGIPGIRYLDGGSRGAGTGTSNYVVFDPEMIRILERNGVATGAKPWQPGEWEGLFKK